MDLNLQTIYVFAVLIVLAAYTLSLLAQYMQLKCTIYNIDSTVVLGSYIDSTVVLGSYIDSAVVLGSYIDPAVVLG